MTDCWRIRTVSTGYVVTCKGEGGYLLNNRHDAERLCKKLNELSVPVDTFAVEVTRAGQGLIRLGEELSKLGEKGR